MIITIDLQPDVERSLAAQAGARGVSLTEYVTEIVAREAHAPDAAGPMSPLEATNLLDLLAPVRGLLTDQEIDTLFSRNPSTSRPVDLS